MNFQSCEVDTGQMHENKQKPSVSNGVRASSSEIQTANLAQLLTVGILTNSSLEIQTGNFAMSVTPQAPKNLTFRWPRCKHF